MKWKEALHNAHVCVFRCVAYAMVLDEKRDKLDAKIQQMLVLGLL